MNTKIKGCKVLLTRLPEDWTNLHCFSDGGIGKMKKAEESLKFSKGVCENLRSSSDSKSNLYELYKQRRLEFQKRRNEVSRSEESEVASAKVHCSNSKSTMPYPTRKKTTSENKKSTSGLSSLKNKILKSKTIPTSKTIASTPTSKNLIPNTKSSDFKTVILNSKALGNSEKSSIKKNTILKSKSRTVDSGCKTLTLRSKDVKSNCKGLASKRDCKILTTSSKVAESISNTFCEDLTSSPKPLTLNTKVCSIVKTIKPKANVSAKEVKTSLKKLTSNFKSSMSSSKNSTSSFNRPTPESTTVKSHSQNVSSSSKTDTQTSKRSIPSFNSKILTSKSVPPSLENSVSSSSPETQNSSSVLSENNRTTAALRAVNALSAKFPCSYYQTPSASKNVVFSSETGGDSGLKSLDSKSISKISFSEFKALHKSSTGKVANVLPPVSNYDSLEQKTAREPETVNFSEKSERRKEKKYSCDREYRTRQSNTNKSVEKIKCDDKRIISKSRNQNVKGQVFRKSVKRTRSESAEESSSQNKNINDKDFICSPKKIRREASLSNGMFMRSEKKLTPFPTAITVLSEKFQSSNGYGKGKDSLKDSRKFEFNSKEKSSPTKNLNLTTKSTKCDLPPKLCVENEFSSDSASIISTTSSLQSISVPDLNCNESSSQSWSVTSSSDMSDSAHYPNELHSNSNLLNSRSLVTVSRRKQIPLEKCETLLKKSGTNGQDLIISTISNSCDKKPSKKSPHLSKKLLLERPPHKNSFKFQKSQDLCLADKKAQTSSLNQTSKKSSEKRKHDYDVTEKSRSHIKIMKPKEREMSCGQVQRENDLFSLETDAKYEAESKSNSCDKKPSNKSSHLSKKLSSERPPHKNSFKFQKSQDLCVIADKKVQTSSLNQTPKKSSEKGKHDYDVTEKYRSPIKIMKPKEREMSCGQVQRENDLFSLETDTKYEAESKSNSCDKKPSKKSPHLSKKLSSERPPHKNSFKFQKSQDLCLIADEKVQTSSLNQTPKRSSEKRKHDYDVTEKYRSPIKIMKPKEREMSCGQVQRENDLFSFETDTKYEAESKSNSYDKKPSNKSSHLSKKLSSERPPHKNSFKFQKSQDLCLIADEKVQTSSLDQTPKKSSEKRKHDYDVTEKYRSPIKIMKPKEREMSCGQVQRENDLFSLETDTKYEAESKSNSCDKKPSKKSPHLSKKLSSERPPHKNSFKFQKSQDLCLIADEKVQTSSLNQTPKRSSEKRKHDYDVTEKSRSPIKIMKSKEREMSCGQVQRENDLFSLETDAKYEAESKSNSCDKKPSNKSPHLSKKLSSERPPHKNSFKFQKSQDLCLIADKKVQTPKKSSKKRKHDYEVTEKSRSPIKIMKSEEREMPYLQVQRENDLFSLGTDAKYEAESKRLNLQKQAELDIDNSIVMTPESPKKLSIENISSRKCSVFEKTSELKQSASPMQGVCLKKSKIKEKIEKKLNKHHDDIKEKSHSSERANQSVHKRKRHVEMCHVDKTKHDHKPTKLLVQDIALENSFSTQKLMCVENEFASDSAPISSDTISLPHSISLSDLHCDEASTQSSNINAEVSDNAMVPKFLSLSPPYSEYHPDMSDSTHYSNELNSENNLLNSKSSMVDSRQKEIPNQISKESSKELFIENLNQTSCDLDRESEEISNFASKEIQNQPIEGVIKPSPDAADPASGIPNSGSERTNHAPIDFRLNTSGDILSDIMADMNKLHNDNSNTFYTPAERPISWNTPKRLRRKFKLSLENKKQMLKTGTESDVARLLREMVNIVSEQMKPKMFRMTCKYCHTIFLTEKETEISCVICYDLHKKENKIKLRNEKKGRNPKEKNIIESSIQKKGRNPKERNVIESSIQKKGKKPKEHIALPCISKKFKKYGLTFAKNTAYNSTPKGYHHCKSDIFSQDRKDSSRSLVNNLTKNQNALQKEDAVNKDLKQGTKVQLEKQSDVKIHTLDEPDENNHLVSSTQDAKKLTEGSQLQSPLSKTSLQNSIPEGYYNCEKKKKAHGECNNDSDSKNPLKNNSCKTKDISASKYSAEKVQIEHSKEWQERTNISEERDGSSYCVKSTQKEFDCQSTDTSQNAEDLNDSLINNPSEMQDLLHKDNSFKQKEMQHAEKCLERREDDENCIFKDLDKRKSGEIFVKNDKPTAEEKIIITNLCKGDEISGEMTIQSADKNCADYVETQKPDDDAMMVTNQRCEDKLTSAMCISNLHEFIDTNFVGQTLPEETSLTENPCDADELFNRSTISSSDGVSSENDGKHAQFETAMNIQESNVQIVNSKIDEISELNANPIENISTTRNTTPKIEECFTVNQQYISPLIPSLATTVFSNYCGNTNDFYLSNPFIQNNMANSTSINNMILNLFAPHKITTNTNTVAMLNLQTPLDVCSNIYQNSFISATPNLQLYSFVSETVSHQQTFNSNYSGANSEMMTVPTFFELNTEPIITSVKSLNANESIVYPKNSGSDSSNYNPDFSNNFMNSEDSEIKITQVESISENKSKDKNQKRRIPRLKNFAFLKKFKKSKKFNRQKKIREIKVREIFRKNNICKSTIASQDCEVSSRSSMIDISKNEVPVSGEDSIEKDKNQGTDEQLGIETGVKQLSIDKSDVSFIKYSDSIKTCEPNYVSETRNTTNLCDVGEQNKISSSDEISAENDEKEAQFETAMNTQQTNGQMLAISKSNKTGVELCTSNSKYPSIFIPKDFEIDYSSVPFILDVISLSAILDIMPESHRVKAKEKIRSSSDNLPLLYAAEKLSGDYDSFQKISEYLMEKTQKIIDKHKEKNDQRSFLCSPSSQFNFYQINRLVDGLAETSLPTDKTQENLSCKLNEETESVVLKRENESTGNNTNYVVPLADAEKAAVKEGDEIQERSSANSVPAEHYISSPSITSGNYSESRENNKTPCSPFNAQSEDNVQVKKEFEDSSTTSPSLHSSDNQKEVPPTTFGQYPNTPDIFKSNSSQFNESNVGIQHSTESSVLTPENESLGRSISSSTCDTVTTHSKNQFTINENQHKSTSISSKELCNESVGSETNRNPVQIQTKNTDSQPSGVPQMPHHGGFIFQGSNTASQPVVHSSASSAPLPNAAYLRSAANTLPCCSTTQVSSFESSRMPSMPYHQSTFRGTNSKHCTPNVTVPYPTSRGYIGHFASKIPYRNSIQTKDGVQNNTQYSFPQNVTPATSDPYFVSQVPQFSESRYQGSCNANQPSLENSATNQRNQKFMLRDIPPYQQEQDTSENVSREIDKIIQELQSISENPDKSNISRQPTLYSSRPQMQKQATCNNFGFPSIPRPCAPYQYSSNVQLPSTQMPQVSTYSRFQSCSTDSSPATSSEARQPPHQGGCVQGYVHKGVCAMCGNTRLLLLTCRQCAKVYYCSEPCAKGFWNLCHRFICKT